MGHQAPHLTHHFLFPLPYLNILQKLLGAVIGVTAVAYPVAAASYLGEGGINSLYLRRSPYSLTGHKIAIGQMEMKRPVQYHWDKLGRWNPPYRLAGLFHLEQLVPKNRHLDSHAGMVAQMMISQDKRYPGVAPGAKLYSTALSPLKQNQQPQQCQAAQFLSQRNGGDVRAINLSYGEKLERDERETPTLDGNALLTLCLDWLSHRYGVLFVVAGNQGTGGIPIPTDHYNGMTIAFSMSSQQGKGQRDREGIYNRLGFSNLSQRPVGIGRRLIRKEINTQERQGVNLVAPGSNFPLYDINGKLDIQTGSSFAAPLVTGTVALLQEYGDRQLTQPAPSSQWTVATRRPEVMKAILINSAVKIRHASLGTTYTLFDKHNRHWLEKSAFINERIPLDLQLGGGQLNALRALQQFQAGSHSPDQQSVPAIAWHYGQISTTPQTYSLVAPLLQGSYAVVTLVWPRQVNLQDTNGNQQFDPGETLQAASLTNLDLALVRTDGGKSVTCASRSRVDNVEHFFCPIPATGQYQIQVRSPEGGRIQTQSYALAWWTIAAPTYLGIGSQKGRDRLK